jgi:hypothetical protein
MRNEPVSKRPIMEEPEVQLEDYQSWSRGSWDQGARDKRDRPVPRDRAQPTNGQRGTRGQQRGRGRRPPHNRPPQSRLAEIVLRVALMQPVANQREMQGLVQPIMQMDGVLRMAMHDDGDASPGTLKGVQMQGSRSTGSGKSTSLPILDLPRG